MTRLQWLEDFCEHVLMGILVPFGITIIGGSIVAVIAAIAFTAVRGIVFGGC